MLRHRCARFEAWWCAAVSGPPARSCRGPRRPHPAAHRAPADVPAHPRAPGRPTGSARTRAPPRRSGGRAQAAPRARTAAARRGARAGSPAATPRAPPPATRPRAPAAPRPAVHRAPGRTPGRPRSRTAATRAPGAGPRPRVPRVRRRDRSRATSRAAPDTNGSPGAAPSAWRPDRNPPRPQPPPPPPRSPRTAPAPPRSASCATSAARPRRPTARDATRCADIARPPGSRAAAPACPHSAAHHGSPPAARATPPGAAPGGCATARTAAPRAVARARAAWDGGACGRRARGSWPPLAGSWTAPPPARYHGSPCRPHHRCRLRHAPWSGRVANARPRARRAPVDRHLRQRTLASIGAAGQRRIAAARVAIVGLGATGGAIAELLARAGVGRLRLIDRDVVETHNLARQRLFTDRDARLARPKAIAATERLRAIDPGLQLEPAPVDLTSRTIDDLLGPLDCVFDGTDNFETRLLLNDWCVEHGVPWIYTGVVGESAHTLTIVPGRSACLRCYMPEPPPPGSVPTCESAGVLGAAVDVAAGFAVADGLRLLVEGPSAVGGRLLVADVWHRGARSVVVERDPDCPCCARGQRAFLRAAAVREAEPLCGRDAVHLPAPPGFDGALSSDRLEALAQRLRAMGAERVRCAERLLHFEAEGLALSLFPDGRAIVRGTAEPARARSFCARWVGR
ncbi:MAG: hypothetical protein D6776_12265 [Planctomycetota bacterium]|nr:MAG: hypothetical protein D6776_12265 [Planctomycetota bacterium]